MRRVLLILPVALVVVALLVLAGFNHDLSQARARLGGRSETLDTSLGKLEYAIVGDGEPVLVIHGAGGGFDQALDVASELPHHGFRVIAPSRFGYLRSAMPSHPTLASQADAYVELLDHLRIKNAVVIGISAGAWSSLELAIRHPEHCRALVELVPANYLPPNTTIHGGLLVRAIFGSDFAAWVAIKLTSVLPGALTGPILGTEAPTVANASSSEKARVQQILDHLLPITPRANGIAFDVKTAATHDPLAVDKIDCPLLAISARDDQFNTSTRAEWLASHVPHGKAIVYSTGGHALVGHFDDATREIVAFLRAKPRLPAGRP